MIRKVSYESHLTPKQYQRIFTQPQESADPDHE